MELQKIVKLIQKFICGLDENDFEIDKVSYCIEFGIDLSINSVFIYDTRVSALEEGISRKLSNGEVARICEFYWNGDEYEFWATNTYNFKLTVDRLDLVSAIIECLNDYNNEVLP